MAEREKLIRADALKEYMKEYRWEFVHREDFPKALEMVDCAPTVDAVPVVRCKDCRWARPKDHREPTDTPRELVCQCFKHHHIPAPWYARLAVDTDDFCSYGERRTDDAQTSQT